MIWKIYMALLFSCFIIVGCEKEKEFNNELCTIERPQDTYNFPIRPGSTEWRLLTTSMQMDSVSMIPDNILLNISTEGLIQTCMDYPRMVDFFASDNLNFQYAIEIITSKFNGLQELFDRSDAGPKIHAYYNQLYPECEKNNWSKSLGSPFLYAWIETIIAQNQILEQYDMEESKMLCSDALQVFQTKRLLDYSIFSQKTSLLISGRVMLINEYAPFVQEYNTNIYLKHFIDHSVLDGQFDTLKDIEILTKDYLSN